MYCGVPEEDPDKLMALVLSGGKSSRMGQDKGTLDLNGERWAQHAGNLCTSLNLSVVYSIQPSQMETYATFLAANSILIDAVDVKGPLAGLLSFYLKYPSTDVLLLPCDMIQLDKKILNELVDAYDQISIGHDILVYQHTDGTIEPMPGIYTSEALKKIYWLFSAGELTKFSMKHCIEISNSFFIPIEKGNEEYFKNANTPEDINHSN
ncbi:molybdenum cofactor guanylyltransferase [Cytophaga aurantiaca]|uniref:molybdenum cofactor guanylyltransferase n=1 Tax=Cytophaga aurantiaca TaxID=29530 RepID=UPI00035CE311|nr:molybdenum cofactor guanylyltransferase [Cytophaga aurantiaca]